MASNPPPDPSRALALDDPVERLFSALTAFYGWYRKMARGMANLQRDRLFLPALDAAMKVRMDEPIEALVDALTRGFPTPDGCREGVHALVALSLDFWTWRRLTADGLSDERASALMATAVRAAAGARSQ